MLPDPLNQFADRLIRNGEVGKFIAGLLEKGVPVDAILRALPPSEVIVLRDGILTHSSPSVPSALNRAGWGGIR